MPTNFKSFDSFDVESFLFKMSLVAHRFNHVEFRIFVIVFFRQAHLKKSKQIFEIETRNVQIDELPRT